MSDETKWTKGPWGTDEYSGFPLDVHKAGTAVMVCRVNESKRGQANARLIAAVPELYGALEWAMRFVEQVRSESPAPKGGGEDIAYHDARAALAKARGES